MSTQIIKPHLWAPIPPTHALKGVFNPDLTAISFLKKRIVHQTMVFWHGSLRVWHSRWLLNSVFGFWFLIINVLPFTYFWPRGLRIQFKGTIQRFLYQSFKKVTYVQIFSMSHNLSFKWYCAFRVSGVGHRCFFQSQLTDYSQHPQLKHLWRI
jgi:hypothetical protein